MTVEQMFPKPIGAQLKQIFTTEKNEIIARQRALAEVIRPNFDAIQKSCGQEMDAIYVSHCASYFYGRDSR